MGKAKLTSPRGDYRQVIRAQHLLRDRECRPDEVAAELGCTRRTVERLLRVMEEEGESISIRREGRAVWYSLGPQKGKRWRRGADA